MAFPLSMLYRVSVSAMSDGALHFSQLDDVHLPEGF